jgi:hypothetical protein
MQINTNNVNKTWYLLQTENIYVKSKWTMKWKAIMKWKQKQYHFLHTWFIVWALCYR